jgi:hypothetical protein
VIARDKRTALRSPSDPTTITGGIIPTTVPTGNNETSAKVDYTASGSAGIAILIVVDKSIEQRQSTAIDLWCKADGDGPANRCDRQRRKKSLCFFNFYAFLRISRRPVQRSGHIITSNVVATSAAVMLRSINDVLWSNN